MLWIPGLERKVLWMPLCFLFFYYVMQLLYQYDAHQVLCFCSWTIAPNANHTYSDGDHDDPTLAELCRHKTARRFERWSGHLSKLTSILTFLLGFYVANMVSQWQTQVGNLLKFTFSFLNR